MQTWTAKALADWSAALHPKDLPDDVVAKAEDCVIDAVACAVAGKRAEGTRRVERVALNEYRDGPADVWFGGAQLHPTGAAFANSAAASILDIDDGHRGPCGHPGAAVVPAALAVAQETSASGADILAAVVAGYETSARVGAAEHRTAYHTGNWTGFGTATVASRLRGLTPDQHMHALAITAYHGPRVADLTLSADMGANVKESIPWSVVTGLNAAALAAEGFSGCRDALDIDERFKPGSAQAGLGDGFQIMATYFKRYSACRWIHGAVEALMQILSENDLAAGDITSIRVETFRQAASLNNLADPPTPESAQYSIPYCLGIAATRGETALMPLSADAIHDPAAITLAARVTVICDEELAQRFPAKVPARLTVTTATAIHEAFVERPWGEPDGPTGRADLVAKFEQLAAGRMPDGWAAETVAAIEGLKSGAAAPLHDCLKRNQV